MDIHFYREASAPRIDSRVGRHFISTEGFCFKAPGPVGVLNVTKGMDWLTISVNVINSKGQFSAGGEANFKVNKKMLAHMVKELDNLHVSLTTGAWPRDSHVMTFDSTAFGLVKDEYPLSYFDTSIKSKGLYLFMRQSSDYPDSLYFNIEVLNTVGRSNKLELSIHAKKDSLKSMSDWFKEVLVQWDAVG